MKFLSFFGTLFLALTLLVSCQKKQEDPIQFILQYKAQNITPEAFLKRLIIQSYIKYKEQRVSKLQNELNLEVLKKETLALIIQEIFVNELANKNSIVIKDEQLKSWITVRSHGTSTANLNLFLNSNGLQQSDWNRMFKNQLLLHKVKEFLTGNTPTPLDGKKEKPKTKKASKFKTYVQIGVISFEDKHDAENAYIRMRKKQTTFQQLMKSKNGSDKFQWLPEDSLPFKDKVKTMRLKRVSRVFQTDWGYSLVLVQKREKRAPAQETAPPPPSNEKWVAALKEFKENPELKINYDLFYGLKLKK